MSCFSDLTPYTYGPDYSSGQRRGDDAQPNTVNIGWLDSVTLGENRAAAASNGDGFVPPEFTDRLAELVKHNLVNEYRGSHICWCETRHRSNGEIRVTHNGVTYVAPQAIFHYVTAHGYTPPQVFIDAVLSGQALKAIR